MKNWALIALALYAVSLTTFSSIQPLAVWAADTATLSAKPGNTAPDFTLPDADGKKHTLSDYRGKLVVLEWVNFECPFVRKHYDSHNMQSLQDRYTKKGIVWLSICSSAPGKHGYYEGADLKKQLQDNGSKATAYLIDADGKVGRTYNAKTTPDMIVIDKKGSILYAGAIDNKPSTDKEDIATANNYVRDALDEAIAGKKIAIDSAKSYGCSIKYAD